MLAWMHVISNSASSELLFNMILVRKTVIYTMLSKLPTRGEMAELLTAAAANCELQKTEIVSYSLLLKCRENGSILTKGQNICD